MGNITDKLTAALLISLITKGVFIFERAILSGGGGDFFFVEGQTILLRACFVQSICHDT